MFPSTVCKAENFEHPKCPSVQEWLNKILWSDIKKYYVAGTSLVVQWIILCTPNAGGPGSIPGQGTRSHMHAAT